MRAATQQVFAGAHAGAQTFATQQPGNVEVGVQLGRGGRVQGNGGASHGRGCYTRRSGGGCAGGAEEAAQAKRRPGFCNGILRLRQFRNGWARCDHTEFEAITLGRPPTWRTKAARPKPRDGEEGGSTTGGMRCTGAGRRDVAICPEATCGGTSRRSMASRAATLTATRKAKTQKDRGKDPRAEERRAASR